MKGTEAACELHENDVKSCGKLIPKCTVVSPLDNEWTNTGQAHDG